MAKAALLDVLRQTIGKYVKNLDTESLSIAVWSGKIELNSLELDVESINNMLDKRAIEAPNLAMPFKVISGNFESFQVDVPWNHILSRPVVLRAQGLSVMVEPLDRKSTKSFDDDDTIEHESVTNMNRVARQKELREQQIDERNNYRLQALGLKKIALAADDNANDGDSSTFASRLARKIIDNIQIQISNVHVSLRNEDGSAGVVLESLKVMSTDKEGRFVHVDRTATNPRNSSLSDIDFSFQYKMLEIEGFGVYLDEDEFESARYSLQSISEDRMSVNSDNSSIYARNSLGHSYVLAPLSFQTKLRIADNPCKDTAKYELRCSLSVLSFLLTRSQVDIVRKVSKILSPSNSEVTPLFPEYRPLVSVKGHAKEWWKYACRCIGRMNGRRSWVEFFEAYRKRRKYIPLFKRYSHCTECSWVKPLNSDELSDLFAIEQDRSISLEGLMTWRNIADAQIDKEREKRKSLEQETTASSSMFSYVFGSRTVKTTGSAETQDEEEPAIVLSVEEMKELEKLSTLDIAENDIAKDALYCDLKFVLDAMKIDLVGYESNHLALLDMGKVAFDFDTTSDGAFTTSFDLYDLQVFDRTTPNSIFPTILKRIESESERNIRSALHLGLSKSANGDQIFVLKMAEFQLVASKLMFQELKLFFGDSSNTLTKTKAKANPVLSKSLSGSVDLFYDAKEGDSFRTSDILYEAEDVPKDNDSPEMKEMLSNKLIDVWKEKSMSKVSWLVDIDVKAPIVLIPEVCNSLSANVMVFDLGYLKLKYGKGDPAPLLQQWFDKYPRGSAIDKTFEAGAISVNDLTFSVQKARFWHPAYLGNQKECAIIDPIGVVIDFAIEDIGPDFEPRSCFFGVIPTISIKLSHVQGSQILEVINSWSDMFVDQGEDIYHQEDIAPLTSPSAQVGRILRSEPLNSTLFTQVVNNGNESYPMVFCQIGLQRLTVTIMDEGQKQLEAHLVSVYASVMKSSDESSVISLTMGWFWVLDWIVSSYERKQRLLIHSNLPRSAESFAKNNEYNIIEELTKEGVFERHYSGSTELADVSFKTFPSAALAAKDIDKNRNAADFIKCNGTRSILNAKFRSLVVHWNPHAIKQINALSTRFFEILADENQSNGGGTLILTQAKPHSPSRRELPRKESFSEDTQNSDSVLILAEMESLGVVLNSAIDDLPLFALTVSGTQLSIVPRDAGQEISLSLGDLRVTTPESSGKTLPEYGMLLGLEDGSSGSLLTVKYYEGREAIETQGLQLAEIENFEAVAFVELSPMRFCYIHSQAMTLVNYVTDGILGAITAQAAISAAEAAKELANSVSGHYYFSIRATSFEAIIPEAAYRDQHLRLNTASLNVDYYMYSDARGSDIRVGLSNLMVQGNLQKDLQESPIQLSIDVKMPMVGVGSLDDQAMRVNAEISKAKFLLTKDQYSQIMNTIESNFGETALFLREDELSGQIPTSAKETHAGVQFVENIQRIYFVLGIKEVSLVLNGRDLSDPLVRLTATEATIEMHMIPDLEKSSINALLQNLVCEDCRLLAQRRQSRFLFDQQNIGNKDIFQIKYCQENTTSNIDLILGSPQVVLIPDLISEVLLFVSGNEDKQPPTNESSKEIEEQGTSLKSIDTVQIVGTESKSLNTSLMKISAQTGTCKFVLMDLGSQHQNENESKVDPQKSDSRSQLTETVVLQGIFAGSLSMESDADLGKFTSANFQCNSDAMEIFTAFGREMKSPLQILEPASASIHGSLTSSIDGDTEIEVRAAALTSIDFSFSIQNAILVMAIIDSVNDSFALMKQNEDVGVEKEPLGLTQKEQERIEKLATALEKIGQSESFAYNENGSTAIDSRASSSASPTISEVEVSENVKVQIKVTMPQARIVFINDLQGMDEALFRISVTNFVAGGNLTSPTTLFDIYCNTSILADYFDSSVNLWSRLLIKPWEMTIKGSRGASQRIKSNRMNSTFDLESFPCWISFSEQFLVSLASAAQMWSFYNVATSTSLDQTPDRHDTDQKRYAARNLNLITSSPNAISNHSGINVSFSLESGCIKDRKCPTGSTQFFRFDPPKGSGYGGTRVYGQDVEVPKLVKIDAEGNTVVVNMDLELGLSPRAHEIGDNFVLYSQVIKDGKTTVRTSGRFLFRPNLQLF